jgi:hypothetical protein
VTTVSKLFKPRANGRIKDFDDIWVTTLLFRFDLATVVEAAGRTLRCRETAISRGGVRRGCQVSRER